jgi:hypothetical protein
METAYGITRLVITLVLYICLIVFLCKDKKINSFVRILLIVTFSLNILLHIGVDFISNVLHEWFYWQDESMVALINSLYSLTYIILLLGLTFFISYNSLEKLETREPVRVEFKKRNILISLLLFFITAGLYLPFWLFKTVKDLKTINSEIPYTPGQAVGYLFIPLFNIYWFFRILFTLPLYVSRIEKKYFEQTYGFQFHPIMISLLWVLMLVLSNLSGFVSEGYTLKYFLGLIFPFFTLWIIYLTIQAKINSFVDMSNLELNK